MIEAGKKVSIEFSVYSDDGMLIDTNVGSEPLEFIHGQHEILPALEEFLIGHAVGDTKEITLTPEEAYGAIREEAYKIIPLESIPVDYRQVGSVLVIEDQEGRLYQVRVHQLSDPDAVVDLNHPLAGMTLTFRIRVLGVE